MDMICNLYDASDVYLAALQGRSGPERLSTIPGTPPANEKARSAADLDLIVMPRQI